MHLRRNDRQAGRFRSKGMHLLARALACICWHGAAAPLHRQLPPMPRKRRTRLQRGLTAEACGAQASAGARYPLLAHRRPPAAGATTPSRPPPALPRHPHPWRVQHSPGKVAARRPIWVFPIGIGRRGQLGSPGRRRGKRALLPSHQRRWQWRRAVHAAAHAAGVAGAEGRGRQPAGAAAPSRLVACSGGCGNAPAACRHGDLHSRGRVRGVGEVESAGKRVGRGESTGLSSTCAAARRARALTGTASAGGGARVAAPPKLPACALMTPALER